jgi:hypothetical protein
MNQPSHRRMTPVHLRVRISPSVTNLHPQETRVIFILFLLIVIPENNYDFGAIRALREIDVKNDYQFNVIRRQQS